MVTKKPLGLLGVSVGKKYFEDKSNMKRYIEYLTTYFEEGHILFADLPKRHNIMAIDGETEEEALIRIKNSADTLEQMIEKFKSQVRVHRWADLTDENYNRNLYLLRQEYAYGGFFHREVAKVVTKFLKVAKVKNITKALPIAKEYVLEELAMLSSVQLFFSKPVVEVYPGRMEIQEKIQLDRYVFAINIRKDANRGFHEVYADKPDVYVYDKPKVGKSLKANKPFERGETILTVSGPVVRRPSIYTVPIADRLFIEPSNEARYLCHSCAPTAGIKNRTEVVALRDIDPGEEIAIDYAMIVRNVIDYFGRTQGPAICNCGEKGCRKILGAWNQLPRKKKLEYKGFVSEYLTGNSS